MVHQSWPYRGQLLYLMFTYGVLRPWESMRQSVSACLVHATQTLILDSNPKNRGSHSIKNLFGTQNLNEDWNPNLNFMWVPWQIWVHPSPVFESKQIQIQTQFFCGSQFITVARPTLFFSLIFSLSPPLLLCLSLSLLSAITDPLYALPLPDSLSSLLSAKPPHGPHYFTFPPSFSFNFCNNPL